MQAFSLSLKDISLPVRLSHDHEALKWSCSLKSVTGEVSSKRRPVMVRKDASILIPGWSRGDTDKNAPDAIKSLRGPFASFLPYGTMALTGAWVIRIKERI